MSTACALVRSPDHLFPDHEEAPTRFQFLGAWESQPFGASLRFLEPRPVRREVVTAVHSEQHLAAFEAACARGPAITDFAPTYVTPSSFSDAFLAAGAAVGCTAEVLEGRAENAFAIVRPPGHHAEPDASMGFCLLNNVALAARYALDQGLERVQVVDFDAHHGNGTQAVFWGEARAGFFSTHQENIYPFRTGFLEEAPHARGRIVNLPLPARAGDQAFAQIGQMVLEPLLRRFRPGLILVSAGFDSHWQDPLAELGLSSAGFHAYSRQLVQLAGELCGGRIVFVLEGGYNPRALACGVEAVLSALTGFPFEGRDPSPFPEPGIEDRLAAVRALHGL